MDVGLTARGSAGTGVGARAATRRQQSGSVLPPELQFDESYGADRDSDGEVE
jgi:hypothetical protein